MTTMERPAPSNALEVRERLVDALRLDLVGPWPDHPLEDELLPGWQRPSNWYLTGFLAPKDAPPEDVSDEDENDDLATEPGDAGSGDEIGEDRKAAKKSYYPSSMGLSILVPPGTASLRVRVTWGDYEPDEVPDSRDETKAV